MIRKYDFNHSFTTHDMIIEFKKAFKHELIGWINNINKPDYRVVVVGGYGIKSVLEEKYNIYGKVKTTDLDLTISTRNANFTPEQCLKYWLKNLYTFSNKYSGIHINAISLNDSWVPGFNYYRKYLINTTYNGDDFIDIAIGDLLITKTMIDKKLSNQVGLPIKTEEDYLKEFLTLVYMENVPGVNPHTYWKRNPLTGQYPKKGKKDILNSKVMCGYVKKLKYKKYCKLLYEITITKLKQMSKSKQDLYFSSLKDVVNNRKL